MFYTQKRKGLPIANIWFQEMRGFCEKQYVICNYQNMLQPISQRQGRWLLSNRDAQTLLSELTLSEEDLLMRCDSNVRNEIRRAGREGVVCTLYDSDALESQSVLLAEFNKAYEQMHRQKEMAVTSVLGYLHTLKNAGALALSVAKMEEKTVAYHVYVTGDGIARLLYSVSVFRDCENQAVRSAIGRANRLLHYADMIELKSQGCSVYDWGGYATDPALESINRFKAGFGGVLVPRYYAIITTHTLVAAGYHILMKQRGKKK